MDGQEEKKNIFRSLKEFLGKCSRVLKVARKPTKEEVQQIAKVSGLGILIIGLLGFVIGIIYTLIFT